MKQKDMNNAIKQAFTKATPDVLESVLSDCGEQKGTVIVMTERKRISWGKKLAAVAAVLALIVGIGFGAGSYYFNNTVVTTVSLDVNPSIELCINRNERVLEATALNTDAKAVLGEMDLKGSDLDVAVNAIIGSMLRNGYISEIANSILISVDSKDATSAAALREKLTAEINTLLNTGSFAGAVLSQTVTHETELVELASQYTMTLGKAQLISRIVAQDSRYTFEELAKLNINELNLLSQSATNPVEDVQTLGKPSDKLYIGTDAAKQAALTHAGYTAELATYVEVEMDYDDGVMLYEVEFTVGGYEYDYDIDAKTGAVLKSEKEPVEDPIPAGPNTPPDGKIGETLAVQTALTHAGLTENQITGLKVKFDSDDGKAHYDVSFHAGGYEYEYEIGAYNPTVLKFEKERDDDRKETVDTPVSGEQTLIGKDAATIVALKHANLTKDQVKDLEVELDEENGAKRYEVSFQSGGWEYDYEIDALTGAVVYSEKDTDD